MKRLVLLPNQWDFLSDLKGKFNFKIMQAQLQFNTQTETQELPIEINLFDIFCLGVDYGQLLMEEERMTERNFDGFLGKAYDDKYAMPMQPIQTRQVHSEKWFEAKRKSFPKFQELLLNLKGKFNFKIII